MKLSSSPSVLICRPVKKLGLYPHAEGARFDQLVNIVALFISSSYLRALKEQVVEGDYIFNHTFEGRLVQLLFLTEVSNLSVLPLGIFLNRRHSGLNLLLMISELIGQGIYLGL